MISTQPTHTRQTDGAMDSLLHVVAREADGREIASAWGFRVAGTPYVIAGFLPPHGATKYEVLTCEGNVCAAHMKACDYPLGLGLLEVVAPGGLPSGFELHAQAALRTGLGVLAHDADEDSFVPRTINAVGYVPCGQVWLVNPSLPPEEAGTPVLDNAGRAIGVVARIGHGKDDYTAVASAGRLGLMLERARKGPPATAQKPRPINQQTTSCILAGLRAEAEGKTDQAIEKYRAAVAADPQFAGTYLMLARALARAGHYEAAVETYSQAISIQPNSPGAYHARALALGNLGRLEEACADWTRVIELGARTPSVFYNRGLLRLKRSDLDGAEEDFSEAIALRPEYFLARIGRGKVRLRRNDIQGALRDFLAAARAERKNASAWALLGEAFARDQRWRSAVDCFTRALALNAPAGHVIHTLRGAALARIGQIEAARRDFDQALKLSPAYAPAEKQLEALRVGAVFEEPAARHTTDADELPPATDFESSTEQWPGEPMEDERRTEGRRGGRLAWITAAALPALLVALGGFGAYWLIKTRPRPARAVIEPAPTLVEVIQASRQTHATRIVAMGTVVPAQTISLNPQVAGRIVEISPNLVPGGRFSAGEFMLRIDPSDYELAVAQQKASVERALAKLEEARQVVARKEWEAMEQGGAAKDADREMVLREPQLKAAQAALAAAQSNLRMAELNLERTVVRAPFDSIVQEEFVEVGQVVGPQSRIATLIGTAQFWVQAAVPVDRLALIRIPDEQAGEGSKAVVEHVAGPELTIARQGRVARLLKDLDPAGRMARVLIAVEDPMGTKSGGLPLLTGAYVRVTIEGEPIENVCVIPRAALREGDEVWLMDDNDHLAIRKVEVVWRQEDSVCIRRGIETGDRVVVSAIPNPVAGMKLRLANLATLGSAKPDAR